MTTVQSLPNSVFQNGPVLKRTCCSSHKSCLKTVHSLRQIYKKNVLPRFELGSPTYFLGRYPVSRKLTIKPPTAFDKFNRLRLVPFSIVISGSKLEGLKRLSGKNEQGSKTVSINRYLYSALPLSIYFKFYWAFALKKTKT